MALRNRNQVPVCRDCHMNVIHRGEYNGTNLKTLKPEILLTRQGYDLRVVDSENYLNPSKNKFYGKSLTEKGWKIQQQEFLKKKN